MSSTVAARTGSQRPRIKHLPPGRRQRNARDSAGPLAVELAGVAGLSLDPWQEWCLLNSLAEDGADGWAAFEVAVLVGRQNGKGAILEARQLAGLFLLRERLQVHTAHEFKTCFEHFLRMVTLIESSPALDAQVSRIRRGAGEQAIELKTGERLRFLARSSGSGRGMSGDCVYLDEAFALTPQMMGALLPTLSARENPQVWYTSSAPMSTSVVLHQVLKRGRAGDSDRLFYAEWGNKDDTDPDDVDAWYRANPALGIRIDEAFVSAELAALRDMPEEFARERLGVPSPLPDDLEQRPPKLPANEWAATMTTRPPTAEPGRITIGWEISHGGDWGSIAIGVGDIRHPYVELIEHKPGAGWMPQRLVELVHRWNPIAVGCIGAGPSKAHVGAVMAAFREADPKISTELHELLSMTDYRAGCEGLYVDVTQGRLQRPNEQGPLEAAALDAAEREYGTSGAWAFDQRDASIPITPLVAAVVARYLLPTEVDITPPALSQLF